MSMLEGLGFPEALRWHDGALWFSDMFRSRVLRWVPGSNAEVVLDTDGGGPTVPGGLGWLPVDAEGRRDLLVVDCEGRRVLRVREGVVAVHAQLGDLMTHSANDMHVDPDGTAWVGGCGFDPERDSPVPSPLFRLAGDGTVSPTGERFVFPNGCERDASGALLVAETFADRISALSAGGVSSLLATLPPGSGPDGLSIAPNGDVYVALAFAGSLARLPLRTTGFDDRDAALEIVFRADVLDHRPEGPGLGVYDCAVHPDGRRVAVAVASLDEELAQREDTGRIVMLELE